MQKKNIGILLLLGLLTFCSTANDGNAPVKIEHITRKGLSQDYKSSLDSKPYMDKQLDEPLFSEQEFGAPVPLENAPCAKNNIEYQDNIETLAKLKRAGRLSQKDYNARVSAMHARVKKAPEIEHNLEKKELKVPLNLAAKQHVKRVEAIHIAPDDEIFQEE